MAKEVAIGKRAKISKAQQNMLLAVLGAAVFLGVAIALTSHFIQQISFNTKVIMAEDESIVSYSDTIKSAGICQSPSGAVYSDSELEKCDPDSIEVSQVPGTLRANVLEGLAANKALNSVPKEDGNNCVNPSTNKKYTYKELSKMYTEARGASELQAASSLIKSCSALRVIPDALPAFKNEEALLASLNKLFIASDWEPESISPGSSNEAPLLNANVNALSVSLRVESDSGTAMRVLNSMERSIREFDIKQATIEWGGNDNLILRAQAYAYYMDQSKINEKTVTITPESK